MLRRHEPFAACPDNFLSACSGLIRVRFVLPEEIIVEEGDFVENALIIEMGSAKVHRQTRPGLRGCPDRTGEVHDSCLDSQKLKISSSLPQIFRCFSPNLRLLGGWNLWSV